MIGYIYITFNIKTKQIYVGKKESPTYVKTYYGSGVRIRRWIRKHGTEDLRNAMIDTAETLDELNSKERVWIALVKRTYGDKCLNYAVGGDGGDVQRYWSEERKEEYRNHMSIVNKQKCTDEVRKNMSEGQKRRFSTDESREEWSLMLKEVWKDEDLRELKRSQTTELWKDEGYRNKMHDSLVHFWSDENNRKEMSVIQKQVWTEDKKKEHSEMLKQYFADNPEQKERLRKLTTDYWSKPENHEKQSQMRKEYLRDHINAGTEAVKVPYTVILNSVTYEFKSRIEMEIWFKDIHDFSMSGKTLNKLLESGQPYKSYYKKFKHMDGMMIYKGNKGVTTIENTSEDGSE